MTWDILADIVLLLHLGFILFVILGGFFVCRWTWLPWVHLPAAAWGIAIEWGDWICPLTYVENWLRQFNRESGYPDGFIEHYLIPIIYPVGLTPEIQTYLGLGVLITNMIAYSFAWQCLFTEK